MRKLLTIVSALVVSGTLFAGGLVTNTNQSALYTRLQSRNASTDIDAVYYNPAGLTKLAPGLHIGLNNQTIGQTRTIISDYEYLNGSPNREFIGTVSAPLFPSVYGVFNLKKFAFSFGFNPVGGGGGATYKEGLPSLEMSPSDLVPAMASRGVSDYRLDAYFEGSSIYFGFQGGVSYKINEIISVFGGARYVTAKNTYIGHLTDVEIFNYAVSGTWSRADVIMTGISNSATGAATATTNIINANEAYGDLTLAQAEGYGIIDATQRAQLEGALTAFGAPTTVTISFADGVFKTAATKYSNSATLLGDQEADVIQTGGGITPIIGVNLSLTDKLNIGIKYEFKTSLEVTNATAHDFITGFNPETGAPVTMFPDGGKTTIDMPAMLAVGVEFRPIDRLMVTGSMNYYFDKAVDYDGSANAKINMIDKNFIETALGVEYGITNNLRASVGWLGTFTGVNDNYQSDMRYSTNTNTIGGGFGYRITPMIDVNIGGMYTMHQDYTKSFSHNLAGSGVMIDVNETYKKSTWVAAVGVDLHF